MKNDRKNSFKIRGASSCFEKSSSKNRDQNFNAQDAEKISTTRANKCQ